MEHGGSGAPHRGVGRLVGAPARLAALGCPRPPGGGAFGEVLAQRRGRGLRWFLSGGVLAPGLAVVVRDRPR
ncbi:hypothetical protein QJS66_11640 [Kocuria rhizophila]|nr:hypothetical protein QJS66_11640 [Kocuria rhizophila]